MNIYGPRYSTRIWIKIEDKSTLIMNKKEKAINILIHGSASYLKYNKNKYLIFISYICYSRC